MYKIKKACITSFFVVHFSRQSLRIKKLMITETL